MIKPENIESIIKSRASLVPNARSASVLRKAEAEGGCGVIGIACDEKIPGRHLLQALKQMRNRGNGKGGGIAAVGLVPEELGVSQAVLENDYLLTVAYLDVNARSEVERSHIDPIFEVDHVRPVPHGNELNSDPQPPEAIQYFVRVRPDAVQQFLARSGLQGSPFSPTSAADEIVYQNSYRLNHAYYASTGEKRAFVLSQGKNMVVLKMVGYGDDVIRHYRLEDFTLTYGSATIVTRRRAKCGIRAVRILLSRSTKRWCITAISQTTRRFANTSRSGTFTRCF